MRTVILNDTRPDCHHGCDRVMAVLERRLRAQGLEIIARAAVAARWWEDPTFLAALTRADLIVINGEGTLHHGSHRGAGLLRVLDVPERRATPVVLLNALYQENPPDWDAPIRALVLVQARDSRSQSVLEGITGGPVPHLPDLTLCDGQLVNNGDRRGVVLGDSVLPETSRALAELSRRVPGARLIPVLKRLKRPKGRTAAGRALRGAYGNLYDGLARWRYPTLELIGDGNAYARALSGSELHITGRFHAICFSILTETPFLALRSNSWKIEALLADFGLSAQRIIALPEAAQAGRAPQAYAFTAQELSALRAGLDRAQTDCDAMFARIAQIAGAGS